MSILIKLAFAWLCPDCGIIGDNSGRCESCGNAHVINLARVLDRPERPARIEEEL